MHCVFLKIQCRIQFEFQFELQACSRSQSRLSVELGHEHITNLTYNTKAVPSQRTQPAHTNSINAIYQRVKSIFLALLLCRLDGQGVVEIVCSNLRSGTVRQDPSAQVRPV